MKCLICGNDKATSYYSPKELYKYNIYLCNHCIKLLMFQDLRYTQSSDEVLRLVKRKENKNERLYCDNFSVDSNTNINTTRKI